MKILVTGSSGFIGRNLTFLLKENGYEVLTYDIDNIEKELISDIDACDFIIHLAGVNRPLNNEEFYNVNTNLTVKIVDLIKKSNKSIPIIFASSIQAELDNDYGKSKLLAENYLLNSNLPVAIYRLYNVYGKYCRPNYNSVVATFCYNIANNLDIKISDEDKIIRFNYVDDVCHEFIRAIENKYYLESNIRYVSPYDECSLGRLAHLIYYFKDSVKSDRHLPVLHDEFEFKLFKTFLSYLRDDGYHYNYASNEKGYFEELYKSKDFGQISDNFIKSGVTKGGHYHQYKKEIFYTVVGETVIRQRNIDTDEMIISHSSLKDGGFIDIIPNFTHDITSLNGDSHTLMWISEIYDEESPDTYKEEVVKAL